MIFYDKTVTIWLRTTSGAWQDETWRPTVITNVRYLSTRGSNKMTSGDKDANTCRLHIMDNVSIPSRPYMTPAAWKNDPDSGYTLTADDGAFFTVGDTSSVTSGDGGDFYAQVKAACPETYRIDSVDRYELIPHWEVWGK